MMRSNIIYSLNTKRKENWERKLETKDDFLFLYIYIRKGVGRKKQKLQPPMICRIFLDKYDALPSTQTLSIHPQQSQLNHNYSPMYRHPAGAGCI